MYVIAGVSGRTGAVVADTLLAAGKPVRVLVRDAQKGAAWIARGAELAVASLEDPAAVARALHGATAAFLLSPQDPRSPDPITTGWRIADAIARGLERSPIGHLVFLSSIGAQHADGTGLVRTLHAAEARLAEAATKITFVRAAYLLDNWAAVLGAAAGGKLPTFIRPDRAIPMVATRDIGAVAARALLEGPPAAARDVIELSGPREYSPRDLAATLAKMLRRPVEPEHAPLEAVVPFLTGIGATPGFAEQVRLLCQGIDDGTVVHQGGSARAVRGTVDAEAFFAAHGRPG